MGLALIRSLTSLAPLSLVADAANLMGYSFVFGADATHIGTAEGIVSWNRSNFTFIVGASVYCFEGMAMVLPLEHSAKDVKAFPRTLAVGMTIVTGLYLSFAIAGYWAFGDATEEIITLVSASSMETIALVGARGRRSSRWWVPNDPDAGGATMPLQSHEGATGVQNMDGGAGNLVKLCLSVAVLLTFPVMMVPCYEIFERNILQIPSFRAASAAVKALVFRMIRMVSVCAVVVGKKSKSNRATLWQAGPLRAVCLSLCHFPHSLIARCPVWCLAVSLFIPPLVPSLDAPLPASQCPFSSLRSALSWSSLGPSRARLSCSSCRRSSSSGRSGAS